MSKKTTNLLGIVIAIVAGTYFNLMLCNTCITETEDTPTVENTVDVAKNKMLAEKKNERQNLDKNN
ncbi:MULTISPECIES: hypothetical protein [Arenibacter]|uniref:hypothetical protein n=1 Tax=Arenibacter TaxID=178469 RepID=UPI001C07A49A|nr:MULTISPECIES: hypothetical protein [Arenibacter]MBU2907164.1 hypothetical protein [Arenibacter algicola]MCK0133162.1 hypothetical protein [Arenibacter sp. S6351L]